ncbi:MAG: hypothetical protein V4519_01815 [Patescibacteria group bacterium]
MELVYKRRGQTPLQALDELRGQKLDYKDTALSYAGRLDPMAEGLMLVLVGEENKEREKYLNLDKDYVVDILFGIETDTYDGLGKISEIKNTEIEILNLDKYIGKFVQEYPPYSSKPVNGKPMFEWAREGKLDEIEIPTKKVEIFSCEILSKNVISGKELIENAELDSTLITGDFRQEEILSSWKNALKEHESSVFSVLKIKVSCSSGTYMRSFAHNLGKELSCGAIAYRIKRTKVGEWVI